MITYYTWILKHIADTIIFIPIDIIKLIINICARKLKLLKFGNDLAIKINGKINPVNKPFDLLMENIKIISDSECMSYAVSDEGNILTIELADKDYMLNNWTNLYLRDNQTELKKMMQQKCIRPIKKIFHDIYFSLILTECNKLIYWEKYIKYGAEVIKFKIFDLGLDIKSITIADYLAVLITISGDVFHFEKQKLNPSYPILNPNLTKLKINNVSKITYSYNRFMILNKKGEVYTCKTIDCFKKEVFVQVAISNVSNIYHSAECFIFLTRNGLLYSSGKGSNHTLGVGSRRDICVIQPKKIPLKNVESVIANKLNCLAITF